MTRMLLVDDHEVVRCGLATYRARVTVKLALSTNVELTRYAMRHKLVD